LPHSHFRLNDGTQAIAETGSGKTTQLPQYAAEHFDGLVICTQPRAIAAMSIARRVAEEFDAGAVGKSVGYVAGQNSCSGSRIMFMTDAALIKMVQRDPELAGVSVLIIDEAHERSLCTDIVLGIAHSLLRRRPEDFHVVVASATIDPAPFVRFYTKCHTPATLQKHVLKVDGRVFPVSVAYKPHPDGGSQLRIADHVVPALHDALEEYDEGHCLVFLTGVADIAKAKRDFERRKPENVDCYELYGSLPSEEQEKVFKFDDKRGTRRMVRSALVVSDYTGCQTISASAVFVECQAVSQWLFSCARACVN
jgi:HrpA-like RNA helicase